MAQEREISQFIKWRGNFHTPLAFELEARLSFPAMIGDAMQNEMV
jgi:hypothetical protein